MKAGEHVQDRYELIEPLGRGGMAEVWLARDGRLERDVAVKFMAANLCHDPEFLVRFFTEAQAVARISHPNVVSVLDFGDYEDRPYLVMEYVPGGALSALTGEPLLPERAVELVTGAARGAGAAHAAGLVHRDVKPANILLDSSGEPKLADFGIASSAPCEKLTATGTAIGSPHYISPEQASGGTVTPASDVYSLGAVLYELLTGAPPFDADNVTAIAIAHVEKPPVPPSVRVAELPEHLDSIVLSCLAKDPAARPRDGAALAEALESGTATATTWVPAVAVDDVYEEEDDFEEPAVKKRWLVPTLLALSLLLALAGAVYVSGRPDDVAEAGTSHPPRRTEAGEPKKPKKPTPEPTIAPTGAPAALPATPSPTSNPEPEEEDATRTPKREEDENDEPLWTPDPAQEPEPTPAPSEEPAPSEDPAPSEEPAPSGEPDP